MVLEQYMLNYFGCVLPSLRSSHDRSHDQQGAEEEGSDTDSEMLLKDIVLVRKMHATTTYQYCHLV